MSLANKLNKIIGQTEVGRKTIDVTSDVISAPKRLKEGVKTEIAKRKYIQTVAMRNFKNRSSDDNKYKSTSFWAKNKN